MISLDLARRLKDAGLVWRTGINDFFGVPDRGMDDKIFVISDMMVTMELLRGWPALTFHGTAEWAADYLLTHDAVWIPTEEQLREALQALLAQNGRSQFQLICQNQQFSLILEYQHVQLEFTGQSGGEVYSNALLHILPTVQ